MHLQIVCTSCVSFCLYMPVYLYVCASVMLIYDLCLNVIILKTLLNFYQ